MSAPRLRVAEATTYTADIPSKDCSAVSSQDAVATTAQARAAAQLFPTSVARTFVPPATARAGTAQSAVPTITLNTCNGGEGVGRTGEGDPSVHGPKVCEKSKQGFP